MACRHFQLAVKFARLFRRLPREVSSLADVFLEIVQLNMAIPEELDQLVIPAPDCSGGCSPSAPVVDAGLEVAGKVPEHFLAIEAGFSGRLKQRRQARAVELVFWVWGASILLPSSHNASKTIERGSHHRNFFLETLRHVGREVTIDDGERIISCRSGAARGGLQSPAGWSRECRGTRSSVGVKVRI
jgi:hypothetical protein